MDAKEINVVDILGSHFISNSSNDSVAGAIFVNAGNGNINNLFITPYNGLTTTFSSCSSKLSGGALYFNASNEIGISLIDSVCSITVTLMQVMEEASSCHLASSLQLLSVLHYSMHRFRVSQEGQCI